MTPEQIAEVRKDFELGLMFHVGKMFPDKETSGCIVMNDDGRYVMDHIQHCWQGYLMAQKHTHGMLERFKPDRFIGNGMRTEFESMTGAKYAHPGVIDSFFKAALTIAGDFPK